MSWITTSETHRHTWPIRLLFSLMERTSRPVTEPMRLWGRTPRVFLSFLRMYRAVDRRSSPLEPSLRSLIMVRVSQINVCPFCVDLNGSNALARGVTEDKLMALDVAESSPLFSEREKAALAFVEAVTITGRKVGDDLRDRLRASFSEDAIVELTGLVAFQNMSSKFNFGLDVPAQGFCRVPTSR